MVEVKNSVEIKSLIHASGILLELTATETARYIELLGEYRTKNPGKSQHLYERAAASQLEKETGVLTRQYNEYKGSGISTIDDWQSRRRADIEASNKAAGMGDYDAKAYAKRRVEKEYNRYTELVADFEAKMPGEMPCIVNWNALNRLSFECGRGNLETPEWLFELMLGACCECDSTSFEDCKNRRDCGMCKRENEEN